MKRKYRYCLVRVRLPDGLLLQGTFHARDRVSKVLAFVKEVRSSAIAAAQVFVPGAAAPCCRDLLPHRILPLHPPPSSSIVVFPKAWNADFVRQSAGTAAQRCLCETLT